MFVQIFLKSGNVNCTDSQFCSGFLYKKLMALLTWGIIFAVMVCRSYFRCALPMHYLRCIYSCIAVVESTTTTYVVGNTYQTLPAPPLESTVIIKQTFIIKLWCFLQFLVAYVLLQRVYFCLQAVVIPLRQSVETLSQKTAQHDVNGLFTPCTIVQNIY